jgi:hypothetical protein
MDIALGIGIMLLVMYAAYRFGKAVQAAEDFAALERLFRVEMKELPEIARKVLAENFWELYVEPPADETEQESNHYGV